jgi:hypothetical protein
MIFLIGVILVAVAVGIAAFFGSKNWEPDNLADTIGRVVFYSGLGAVATSCIIALAKVMP